MLIYANIVTLEDYFWLGHMGWVGGPYSHTLNSHNRFPSFHWVKTETTAILVPRKPTVIALSNRKWVERLPLKVQQRSRSVLRNKKKKADAPVLHQILSRFRQTLYTNKPLLNCRFTEHTVKTHKVHQNIKILSSFNHSVVVVNLWLYIFCKKKK